VAVGEHRALLALLALGAAIGTAIEVAYWPALVTVDGFGYVRMAHEVPFVVAEADRPSGYPLILELLAHSGSRLAVVTILQHLAVLLVGVVVYATLLRLGSRRWVALLPAAVVLVGSDLAIAAQYVMTETFFALALAASAFLVAGRDRGPVALAASGALLAIAATLRTAGVFAVPAWLAYVCWTHRSWRPVAMGVAGLAVPLVAYSAWYASETGTFGLTGGDGWFLYGRVAEFADCGKADVPAETRVLCVPPTEQSRGEGPSFYLFSVDSPARKAFVAASNPDLAQRRRNNRLLRRYALAVIRDQPVTYARVVGRDFLKFFTEKSRFFVLPPDPLTGYGDGSNPGLVRLVLDDRRNFLPGFEPRAAAPKAQLRDYDKGFWVRPPLLGALLLAALVAIAAALARRRPGWVPRRREIMLLAGMALGVLLGSVATSDYAPRYMTPLIPLIVAAGLLALEDLVGLRGCLKTPRVRLASAGSSGARTQGGPHSSKLWGRPRT
jgi:hypothetical protein